MKILKQVVAIDVAQKELVICLGKMNDDLTRSLYASKTFANTQKGFESLLLWVNKQVDPAAEVRFIMEATGVYHEKLAYFLSESGNNISIVVPNKISNYARTLNVKTVTDKTASEAIAMIGLDRNLDRWTPPPPHYKQLRHLTRERDQVIAERTMIKNQLHAESSQAHPGKSSIARMKKRIALLNTQEVQIKAEIHALIATNKELKQTVKQICTMPGVGELTAATVLAETNGFELIRNKRQLSSYAGLDVIEKQSGTSVRGKSRISKRGNKYLRKALHMPALSLLRSEKRYKEIFKRLVSKHGIKMKAAVAIQRKMLEMIYTLFKTKTDYDPNYLNKKIGSSHEDNPLCRLA